MLRLHSPIVLRALLLELSVYAASISVNAHSLIPTLLVYDMLPKIPDVNRTGAIPENERKKLLAYAQDK